MPTCTDWLPVPFKFSLAGLVIAISVWKREKKKKSITFQYKKMYVGNGAALSHTVGVGRVGEGRKRKRRRLFFSGPALARHGFSCLWVGGRNLDLSPDMIWKSINIISDFALALYFCTVRYEAGSIFFDLERRNIVRAIWLQPCAQMPPENETVIYLLSRLKTKIYVRANVTFLFGLFLSPANWTVPHVKRKHRPNSGNMEPDTLWFDSVWRYFLTAIGYKPSRLLFTSNGTVGQTMFFFPLAFSGDQCYYWVGSNYRVAPPPSWNWILTGNLTTRAPALWQS